MRLGQHHTTLACRLSDYVPPTTHEDTFPWVLATTLLSPLFAGLRTVLLRRAIEKEVGLGGCRRVHGHRASVYSRGMAPETPRTV